MYGVVLKVVTKTRTSGEEYETEAADKEAIEDLLEGDLPPNVRRALQIRLEAAKASVKKLERFEAYAGSDGRARGNVQYHAAAPGRWAGRGIQLQNMVRAGITKDEGGWESVCQDLKELDSDTFELMYGPPLGVISRMLRGAVVAAPGNVLYYGDYSNVEARGCAWAAGQDDAVALFASGGKIYEEMGAYICGLSVEEVIEGHVSGKNKLPRFIGKDTILGCGYGMGAAKFKAQAKKKAGVIIPDDLAARGVSGWRERHGRIVAYWKELENAAKAAISDPGQVYSAGQAISDTGQVYSSGHVSFRKRGAWLQCRLPSGRILWYRRPTIEPKTEDLEAVDNPRDVPEYRWAIHYWTVHPYTKQWCRVSTWGGKLLQNIIEGICRDFLAGAMLRLDAAGYSMILSVHAEAIAETDKDFGSVAEFKKLMTIVPPWAEGFPLKAEAGSGTRYAK